ncbi:hypothetical protein [Tenacibaculum maritimum]|uniref:hypothetical protein n=2 Tax=Tenacibaculum maritimum TaxID=107401 RepID=UPI0012E57843|nr:hypothetical protein [Tenacibaculum maritimum]CAA0248277.1 hypothetical protein TMP248_60138 [Tenacibaculum maritimum]
MKDNKIALVKVLQYDKFNPGVLTIYDRMLIHNYRNQKKPISTKLKDKILIISEEIHLKNWEAPIYRYNQERSIEIFNCATKNWEISDLGKSVKI